MSHTNRRSLADLKKRIKEKHGGGRQKKDQTSKGATAGKDNASTVRDERKKVD